MKETFRANWQLFSRPGEDPIGKTFESEGMHTVVGVIADARLNNLMKTTARPDSGRITDKPEVDNSCA